MNASDYMITHPICVRPDTDLFTAIQLILKNKISGVIVVDERNHPVGMLSELDCLRALLKGTYHQEVGGTVGEYMKTPCEVIDPSDDIMAVAQSMLEKKRRRRPVVDENGEIMGQVTCRQILHAIRDWNIPSGNKRK